MTQENSEQAAFRVPQLGDRYAIPTPQENTEQVALRMPQLVIRYGISIPTIQRHVKAGIFPKPKKIGRCSVWFKKDLEAFEASLES